MGHPMGHRCKESHERREKRRAMKRRARRKPHEMGKRTQETLAVAEIK